MNFLSQFLVYLTLFRLAVLAAGTTSIVLGYQLFVRGVFPSAGEKSSVEFKAVGTGFTLKNAAPGTGFALFGVILIVTMLIQGSPKLTYEMMQRAAGTENISVGTKLEMRGLETSDKFTSLVDKGIAFEKAGETQQAMAAYQQALSEVSVPMNQLAWIYFQQDRPEDALPLARMAAELNPRNAAALDTFAEVLNRQGNRADALKWMEKAASLDPRYTAKLNDLKQTAPTSGVRH
jgi:tetratricopeptide (TPR) repeat protein